MTTVVAATAPTPPPAFQSKGPDAATAAATPTPTPTPADESVAWQSNAQHDGNNPASSLAPPLTLAWQRDLSSLGVSSISYPLIAQGRVIITTTSTSNYTDSVMAFDERTGKQLWSAAVPGTYGFVNAAYDASKVFVLSYDGLLQALDATSGNRLWSVSLGRYGDFTSPPTAINGLVFAAGVGTLYAVDQNNGNIVWSASGAIGDHSSPAVIPGRVFVSSSCSPAYAFATSNGEQVWHDSEPCESGAGKTAVSHLGKLYVRGISQNYASVNLILSSDTGASLGKFISDRPPVFKGNLGLYSSSGTLRGVDVSSGHVLWSFAGDGHLTSAPLIVNQTIYVGSSSGLLYGLDLTGHQIWSTQIGAAIPSPDEQNAVLTTGLGAGDGLLVVPAGSLLAVYVHAPPPTPTPIPTATPAASDQSVTFQNNAQHDGHDAASHLSPPLVLKWQKDLTPVKAISYPLIAQGRIIVTTATSNVGTGSDLTKSVMAFDESTGKRIWSMNVSGTYSFLNAAYDADKVFVVNFDGLLFALDAASGKQLWSIKLPNQDAFTSPPTANNGLVFVGGSGSNGTLYAVDEDTGKVVWTAFVEVGDRSSPAVLDGSVFVSYACPQSYAFATKTGQQLWHYSGPCEGGGGKTAVVHLGKVYVRDAHNNPTNGLILSADAGARIGNFNSDRPPAFSGNVGLYLSSGTLRAVDVSTGQLLWTFNGDGKLTSAPLIVNQTIYVGSSSGLLYGLDLHGHQIWSTQVGASIPAPDEQNAFVTTGLGAGDDLLVVPTGSILAVYTQPPPAELLNISTRVDVQNGDNVLIGGFIINGPAEKRVLIRALGPSLPVNGALQNPILELHGSNRVLATNDSWKVSASTGASQQATIEATGIPPKDDRECALIANLPANGSAYTAIVREKNGGTGIGQVEVYDLDAAPNSQLANISTRGFVGIRDNVMIGGVIAGRNAGSTTMLLRAIGPSLRIAGELADPMLELHNANGATIATNDNWKVDDKTGASQQSEIEATKTPPKSDLESALIYTVTPGNYTAIVRGKNNTTGIALVEAYNLQ